MSVDAVDEGLREVMLTPSAAAADDEPGSGCHTESSIAMAYTLPPHPNLACLRHRSDNQVTVNTLTIRFSHRHRQK